MDNKKRILLLGDPTNIHIYNYVKNVLCYEGFDITIINQEGKNTNIREKVSSFYSKHNVKIIEGYKPVEFWKRDYHRFIQKTIQLLKELGPFDILHEHYIKHYISPALFKVRNLYGKIILTYFGSDIFRIDPIRRMLTLPSLWASDRITLISDDMMDYFKTLPFYYRKYTKKCSIIDFGNMFYDSISSLNKDKQLCKEFFGFDSKKILITLGYNGRPQMQQFETLSSLISDNRILGRPLQFAIPAYGISDDNYNKLQTIAHDNGLSFKIFRHFMEEEEVSKLRVGTDIFIHAQTTDALSSTMLEYLFAGSIVLNGSWLRYKTLINNNVYFRKFDDFKSLSDELNAIIDNLDKELKLASGNEIIISQMSSWESLRPLWLGLYA